MEFPLFALIPAMVAVIVVVPGDAAEIFTMFAALPDILADVMLKPPCVIENDPPSAADVPPPTNVAVTAALVMIATFTFWSIVTVKLLE